MLDRQLELAGGGMQQPQHLREKVTGGRVAEFCRTDPARLKHIAMINLDDVEDGMTDLEHAARLGLSGAMITAYPLEHRRYDGSEYEPFWAAAEALDLPLSLHTAMRRQGRIRRAGDKTLRDASSRATKAFYLALSICDLVFPGVFERHSRLTLIVAWSFYPLARARGRYSPICKTALALRFNGRKRHAICSRREGPSCTIDLRVVGD